MGNVLCAKPPFKMIVDFVCKYWAPIAIPRVQYYKKGWFAFRFKSEDDTVNILNAGPW